MADEEDMGDITQFPVREILKVKVGEKDCVLVRPSNDQVCIFEDYCPHLGLPLSGGRLDGDNLVCRWHGAHFSLTTGESLSPMSDEPLKMISTHMSQGRVLCKVEP